MSNGSTPDTNRVKFVLPHANPESDEIMIHYPSGRVEFKGFWDSIKLLWHCMRHNTPFLIQYRPDDVERIG